MSKVTLLKKASLSQVHFGSLRSNFSPSYVLSNYEPTLFLPLMLEHICLQEPASSLFKVFPLS